MGWAPFLQFHIVVQLQTCFSVRTYTREIYPQGFGFLQKRDAEAFLPLGEAQWQQWVSLAKLSGVNLVGCVCI